MSQPKNQTFLIYSSLVGPEFKIMSCPSKDPKATPDQRMSAHFTKAMSVSVEGVPIQKIVCECQVEKQLPTDELDRYKLWKATQNF